MEEILKRNNLLYDKVFESGVIYTIRNHVNDIIADICNFQARRYPLLQRCNRIR
jgi:hypothetical protein